MVNVKATVVAAFVLAGALIGNALFFFYVAVPGRYSNVSYSQVIESDLKAYEYLRNVPTHATVLVTPESLPRHPRGLRVSSYYDLFERQLPLPQDAEYALIDFQALGSHLPVLKQPEAFSSSARDPFKIFQWGLAGAADNLCLFQKGLQTPDRLYEVWSPGTHSLPSSDLQVFVAESVHLMGTRLGPDRVKPGETVRIRIGWVCVREPRQDFWLLLRLVDEEGRVLHQFKHPICYGLYPTSIWKSGQHISEDLWMIVPSWAHHRDAVVKAAVVSQAGHGGESAPYLAHVESNRPDVFDAFGFWTLGRLTIE